jgi:chemotaxis signal transduction protein
METPSSNPTQFKLTDELAQPVKVAAVRRGVARVLEYARERYVALPPHTTIELLETPTIIQVPGAAAYAHGLMSWQGVWLPVINLELLLHGDATHQRAANAPRYALVVAYQPAPRQAMAHGAIALSVLPQFTAVTDDMQCEWPDDNPRWPQLALSCFQHEGHAAPILDSSRLFARYHEPLPLIQDAARSPA